MCNPHETCKKCIYKEMSSYYFVIVKGNIILVKELDFTEIFSFSKSLHTAFKIVKGEHVYQVT